MKHVTVQPALSVWRGLACIGRKFSWRCRNKISLIVQGKDYSSGCCNNARCVALAIELAS